MDVKNRFSDLLEQLMQRAGLKNNVLAQRLQYDVSYISKWISGRMLPAEKSVEKVLREISECIVETLDEEGKQQLYDEYLVENDGDLTDAVYDNLKAEYDYAKNAKRSSGIEVAPNTSFFLELPMLQFLIKMKHPVLRRVKSLEIAAAVDILALEHEYRLMVVGIEGDNLSAHRDYPGVHFSMLINMEVGEWDYLYDPLFFMNMLTGFSNVDFYLYENVQAHGKAIFAVKDAYVISGMLFDNNHCMSVVTSENAETCNTIYGRVISMCNDDMLLFRSVTMHDMFVRYHYIQALLSTNLRWLIGHMAECFVPDDLFEEILSTLDVKKVWKVDVSELRRIHSLLKNVLEDGRVKIMIYESTFTNFVVSGELDFFNYKIYLEPMQRMRYMKYLLSVLNKNQNLQMKLIQGRLISNFQSTDRQSLYMSDVIGYLRLDNYHYWNNIAILNRPVIAEMFDRFYYEIWNNQRDVVIEDQQKIKKCIDHYMKAVLLLSQTENTDN